MGDPKALKLLVVLALVVGLGWAGYRWLRENPEPGGIQNIQQEPYRPPDVPNPVGGK